MVIRIDFVMSQAEWRFGSNDCLPHSLHNLAKRTNRQTNGQTGRPTETRKETDEQIGELFEKSPDDRHRRYLDIQTELNV